MCLLIRRFFSLLFEKYAQTLIVHNISIFWLKLMRIGLGVLGFVVFGESDENRVSRLA